MGHDTDYSETYYSLQPLQQTVYGEQIYFCSELVYWGRKSTNWTLVVDTF